MLVASLIATALASPIAVDQATFIAQGPSVEAELVLVEVWATWCGPCHETFPVLSQLQATHGDQLRVVALTDDPASAVRRFFHARREQMRFAVAVDPSGDTVRSLMFGGYGGRGLPSAYLLREGQVVWGGEVEAAPEAVRSALDTPK